MTPLIYEHVSFYKSLFFSSLKFTCLLEPPQNDLFLDTLHLQKDYL